MWGVNTEDLQAAKCKAVHLLNVNLQLAPHLHSRHLNSSTQNHNLHTTNAKEEAMWYGENNNSVYQVNHDVILHQNKTFHPFIQTKQGVRRGQDT